MEKRSLAITGHRTSLALEPEFWLVLEQLADQRQLSLAALIKSIDETRATANLASACRVAALAWAGSGITEAPR